MRSHGLNQQFLHIAITFLNSLLTNVDALHSISISCTYEMKGECSILLFRCIFCQPSLELVNGKYPSLSRLTNGWSQPSKMSGAVDLCLRKKRTIESQLCTTLLLNTNSSQTVVGYIYGKLRLFMHDYMFYGSEIVELFHVACKSDLRIEETPVRKTWESSHGVSIWHSPLH
uniref:Uncharacterized protein n=1 Tax=Strigamia maritima TaxID=126957 RepID=T1JAQ5_STRMM